MFLLLVFKHPIKEFMDLFSDEYFMRIALREAKAAFEKGEIPVGAIVVAQNQIISKTHNLTELLCDVTAHAEMQAISAASHFIGGKYLKSCTLFVTLEPCQMCAGALYWSQISRVVVGASDEKRGYRTLGARLHPKTETQFGVMQSECKQLLIDFFEQRR